VDAIIYEASIRDLTSSKTSKAVNKGKFKGLLENHKNEGINFGSCAIPQAICNLLNNPPDNFLGLNFK